MNDSYLHPSSIKEAHRIQRKMAERVSLGSSIKTVRYIAGMDVSNNLSDPNHMVFAAAVVLSYPSLEVVETACYAYTQTFPYIPGLLGFR